MMWTILWWFILFSPCALSDDDQADQPTKSVLGGIFYQDKADVEEAEGRSRSELLKEALMASGQLYNFKILIKEIQNDGNILEISKCVCELAEEGVMGIIDGVGGWATENIQALCDALELPHVVIQHTDLLARNWSLLNMFPSPSNFNNALRNLIELKDWQNFTILYSRGYSVLKVSDLMMMANTTAQYTINVWELGGNDYRDVLIAAKQNGCVNFVVDCLSENLELLLSHAQQAALMDDIHSYIFVSPDLFTLDMERYRFGGVNMTGLRLSALENSELWNFTDKLNSNTDDEAQKLLPEQLKLEIMLIYDAVKIFSEALKNIDTATAESLSCETLTSWKYGSTMLNFMKTNRINGLTGPLIFDGIGQRSQTNFDILELTTSGNQSIGQWKDNKLIIDRQFMPDAEIGEENIMRNKTLKVLIALTPPYAYVKETSVRLEKNDRYEGFTIDIIQRLSELIGFSYEFDVRSAYGKLDKYGNFDGMVRELQDEKADLAICDFTMTLERQGGIDFSIAFMTLGIGILYKQPSKQPPEMFSFMAVFSTTVWINMMFIQLALGAVMIFVGRISHSEWQNPVPCIEQPEELSNQFSFANSVWLIIGSVMQQGSEIAPIALAPRMITSIWWFFTLVMVASYVGTLVAFLTIEKNDMPFSNVDELYRHKFIQYGCKHIGTTKDFFKNSNKDQYQKMFKKMEDNGWLVKENDDGVKRANGDVPYAFFMESASIEYTIERFCDLRQVGDLLDSKSYGIGMKKGSPYKKYIDEALLKLKENGEIQIMKNKWWKEMHGGGKCEAKPEGEQKQIEMKNIVGSFVILGGGCIVGVLISTLDMLWGVFKRTVKYGTTFKLELIEELKFVFKFSGNVKPVKRKAKPVDGSEEAIMKAEGRDEIMSLPSIRSRRSTSTNKTCHSHSSRHSSRSLAVAFAKRRSYS